MSVRELLEAYEYNWSYVDRECGPHCAPNAFLALWGLVQLYEDHLAGLPPNQRERESCGCKLCVAIKIVRAGLKGEQVT